MMGRARRRVAVALACLALAYLAGFAAVVSASLRYDAPLRPGAAPSAAIVFYTDAPSERAVRVEHAVALWREGLVSSLIMAGGARPGRGGYRGSVEMAEEARRLGVPENALRADAGSNDTLSNLREAARVAAELRARTVVMVSDRLHLVRIELMAGRFCEPFDCRFSAAPETMTWTALVRRVNHELLAYVAALLPRSAVEAWLARTRNAAAGRISAAS